MVSGGAETTLNRKLVIVKIYHSYGSAYSWRFALQALKLFFLELLHITKGHQRAHAKLKTTLEEHFGGTALLVYKGRHAIELALRGCGVQPNETVFTQGFACHAIEAGIRNSGAHPIYVDIADTSLNLSRATLEKAQKEHGTPKAVIVQYSLGTIPDIAAIAHWCNDNEVVLVEDVAQSFGGVSAEDIRLGTYGDAVVCSFGRDKIIDAVVGGAVIFRSKAVAARVIQKLQESLSVAQRSIVLRDLFFPVLMWCIRVTDRFLVGKILYKLARRYNVLSSPIVTEVEEASSLPGVFCELAQLRLDSLTAQLNHRKKIARIYSRELADFSYVSEHAASHMYLRYPIMVSDPKALAAQLKKFGIHLSDRWYRAVVDCGSFELHSLYEEGQAPRAEFAARHVFNLPTHQRIQEEDALQLASYIRTKAQHAPAT